jgi:hypothetical protein
VDRRFNQRRYNAAKTIEVFSARLRNEVDLDTLSAELLAVVDQTMEPTRSLLNGRGSVVVVDPGEQADSIVRARGYGRADSPV